MKNSPRPFPAARLISLTGALLSLAACDLTDPYLREGMWHPSSANAVNRELMVARPSDLVLGRGTVDSDGATAAAAIDRLRNDKVKKLPDSAITGSGSASVNSSGT